MNPSYVITFSVILIITFEISFNIMVVIPKIAVYLAKM
jgi:hypothetical protein